LELRARGRNLLHRKSRPRLVGSERPLL